MASGIQVTTPVSKRTDVKYPLSVQFEFFPSPGMRAAANRPGRMLVVRPRREGYVVTSPQKRAKLYLDILRGEYERGRFDVRTPQHAAARAYEIERDAYLAHMDFVDGGNVHTRYRNQPGFVQHGFKTEYQLRTARYELALHDLLLENINKSDRALLTEKPQYQIVNEYYGTLAEHLFTRRHFSHIVLKDPALQAGY